MGFEFNDEQIKRYSRQFILPGVGGAGQEKLRSAKVLIIGAGGLGSPCALYLAGAGVGKIGIVDSDVVDVSNLQRQILHSTEDVGIKKVESAAQTLKGLNPEVEIATYDTRVDSGNILELVKDYDAVADGSDNFPTRYLMNDACFFAGKPLFHAGIFRFEGQVMTITRGSGPCYRCLFPEPPPPGAVPSCQEGGILGSVAGMIGSIQANEVLKFILNVGELLTGKLLIMDTLTCRFRTVTVRKDPDCPLCGKSPSVKELIDYEQFCSLGI